MGAHGQAVEGNVIARKSTVIKGVSGGGFLPYSKRWLLGIEDGGGSAGINRKKEIGC